MTSKLDQARMRVRWQGIKEQGLPPRESDPLCGDRYSFPCLVGNENTGQVGLVAHIYDYDKKGWMPFDMSDGPDSDEYETQFVSHWVLWPRCRFVCSIKSDCSECRFWVDHSFCPYCGKRQG